MASCGDTPSPIRLKNKSENPETKRGVREVLRLWFGMTEQVTPATYAISGFTLMLFKYSVESFVIWVYTSSYFSPWDFL